MELLRAIRTQIGKDESREHRSLFRYYVRERRISGALYRACDALGGVTVRSLLCAGYALFRGPKPLGPGSGRVLAVSGKRNEGTKLADLRPGLDALDVACVRWGWHGFPPRPKRLWRLLRLLNRRRPLFVALRASETLVTYLRLREHLRRRRPAALLVSTEGNPHGIASMAAARAMDIPVVYASHAAVVSSPTPIRCRLALLHGPSAEEAFRRAGARMDRVLLYGMRDRHRPLVFPPPGNALCLTLGKAFDFEGVLRLVGRLVEAWGSAPLVLRPHPDSLARASLRRLRRALRGRDVALSLGEPLEDALRPCRLAFGGNSTVHLDALLRGVPSVFAPELDAGERTPHAFIREGLVPTLGAGEPLENLEAKLAAHYGGAEWAGRLAAYVNVEDTAGEFHRKLRRELGSLVHE